MVVEAGADIVDINMGCPVRKVTKTGAGSSLIETDGGDLACRLVEAVADAVDVPVTVKMRRGQRDGSRAFLAIGPRLADAGARALTLHPRSAQQMYTGRADHSLTAELVEAVDIPVIASGDVTSRATAEAVLHTTGCAAIMVARAAQGNPWLLRELADGVDEQPSNDEIVAELVRYARAVVHEIGERRAVPFLRKFHPWYLRRGTFARTLRQELGQHHHARGARGAAVRRGAGCPRAGRAARRRRRRSTTRATPSSACRSPSTAAASPAS